MLLDERLADNLDLDLKEDPRKRTIREHILSTTANFAKVKYGIGFGLIEVTDWITLSLKGKTICINRKYGDFFSRSILYVELDEYLDNLDSFQFELYGGLYG